ncbi:hypothetical protein ACFQX6_58155 [Streptosporangium lutulentum]
MENATTAEGLTFSEGEPGAFLRPYVTHLSAYTERRTEPLARREPPFAGAVVIFGFSAPLGVGGPDGSRRLRSFVGGLHDTYVDTVTAGVAEGVQVNLTPIGAWRLLGVPMRELANRVVSLEEVLGRWATTTVERLAEAPSRAARLALLDEALSRRIGEAPSPTGGSAGVGAPARRPRRGDGVLDRRRAGLESPAPGLPVPRPDRAGAEGGGPGAALRARRRPPAGR